MIDKMLALFTYLPRNDAIKVVGMLRDEAFLSTVKIDRDSLNDLFDDFEKISEKKLPAAEREARLRPVPAVSSNGLFGGKTTDSLKQEEKVHSSLRY